MGNFSNAFRRFKDNSALTGSFKQVISGVPGQTILAAINNYKDHLQTNCGPQDSVICALASSEQLIKDQFVDNEKVSFYSDERDFSVIPDSIKNDIVNGLAEGLHEGQNINTEAGITISDSVGRAYNIIDQRSNNIYVEGNKVLFSVTTNVSRISEALIYQSNDGKMYLNNFIRSNDFVKAQGQRVKPTTCLELSSSILLIMSGWGGNGNLFENCLAIADAPAEPDIYSALYDFSTQLGYDGPFTIYNMLSWIWDYENELNPLDQGKGKITNLWSVVRDQIESSTLNQFILETCEDILGGYNNATAVTSTIIRAAQSKYKNIRSFGNGIAHAFNRGGVYGVACYIVTYLKDITNLRNENGVMAFADNASLTPKIYLAGIVQTIVTAVTTLITVIATIFSRIAGAVLAVVGTFISQLFKVFQYDYDSTRASLNTSDKVVTPTAPYGVMQQEIPIQSVSGFNKDLDSLFEQGIYMFSCYIPGGCMFIGPGSFNDNNEIQTVRIEVHPLIVDCSETFDWLTAKMKAMNLISASGLGSVKLHLASLGDGRAFAQEIMRHYANHLQDYVLSNESDDVLSAANDLIIRKRLLQNLFICGVFMSYAIVTSMMNDPSMCQFDTSHDEDDFWLAILDTNSVHCGFWAGFQAYARNFGAIPWSAGQQQGWRLYTREDGQYDDAPSWTLISKKAIQPITTAYNINVFFNIARNDYYDNFNTLPSNAEHAIFIPKYDAATFWAVIIASVVVTAAVAVAVAVVTVKVRKAIQAKRAENQANVQRLHQQFVDNPSAQNYKDYRKAVRKNNMWANLIGGSKYDYVNYWNGDTAEDTSVGATEGSSQSPFTMFSALGTPVEADNTTDVNANSIDGSKEVFDLAIIQRLITGQS